MTRAEMGSWRRAGRAVALEETGRRMADLLRAMLDARVASQLAAESAPDDAAGDDRTVNRREARPGGEE